MPHSDHHPKGRRHAAPPMVRRHGLVARLAQTLERRLRGRVPDGAWAPMVVAVSGGADSVALLLAMKALADRRRRPRPMPIVAHVHHHLRGADADADAAFVADLAARLGVPHERRDVHPAAEPGSIAAAARRLRLEALRDVAATTGRRVVLTAHHAEDQLETVLMRLVRGVDPARLGMPALRPITSGSDILLVRPLLEVPRAELRSLCTRAGEPWREDASNTDLAHPRVRLRTEVLPALESLVPGAAARAAASVERDDPAATDRPGARSSSAAAAASPTISLGRDALSHLAPVERGAAIRAAALELAPDAADRLSRAAISRVADAVADPEPAPRRWPWPAGLTVHLDVRELRLERRKGEF